MKKRMTAMLLCMLMALTAFPVTTWAEEDPAEAASEIVTVQQAETKTERVSSSPALLGSVGSTTDYLNETERQIYTQLKSIIEQQAVKGGRMQFWVSGLSIQVPLENGTGEDTVNQAVSDYIDENINAKKIFSCLVLDLPYHMY